DDRDGDRLGVDQGSVGSLDDDVVDIVGARIGRIRVIGRSHEGKRTGIGVDDELRRIGTAYDRIGQRRARLGGGDGGHCRGVFSNADGGGGAAAIGGDDGIVHVGNRDRDRLGVGQGAVGNLHGDVVDIVGARVGGWDGG